MENAQNCFSLNSLNTVNYINKIHRLHGRKKIYSIYLEIRHASVKNQSNREQLMLLKC